MGWLVGGWVRVLLMGTRGPSRGGWPGEYELGGRARATGASLHNSVWPAGSPATLLLSPLPGLHLLALRQLAAGHAQPLKTQPAASSSQHYNPPPLQVSLLPTTRERPGPGSLDGALGTGGR